MLVKDRFLALFKDLGEDIYQSISDHMSEQPIKIHCMNCKQPLNMATDYDNDLDLTIAVEPCPNCKVE